MATFAHHTSTTHASKAPGEHQVYVFPASPAAQRMWVLHSMDPDSRLNISVAWDLAGPLDLVALHCSLDELVRRHEALRTTFANQDGGIVQLIEPKAAIPLEVVDLRQLPRAEQERETRRLTSEAGNAPFSLELGPLFRARLLRLGEQEHVLQLTMHHIVSDGHSLNVLQRELRILYHAFLHDKRTVMPLPSPLLHAVDVTSWQQRRLSGDRLETLLSYWKRHLAGAPGLLDLPIDRPRPPLQTYRGASHGFLLPPPLREALLALCRQEHVTLFMLLIAAFQVLLFRYTDQDDMVIGIPVAQRNRPELSGVVGLLVNSLPLRFDLSGTPSFHALLQRVRSVCLGAYAHQDLPFERIVSALRPARDPSHHPLFQVFFALQNVPETPLALTHVRVQPRPVHMQSVQFDLTMECRDEPAGLHVRLEYKTDLFDTATIGRMAGHFQRLLEGVVANPAQCIAQLPMLTEAERDELLLAWNATQAPYAEHACIHQLIEAQVACTPDAPALVFGTARFTYQELDAQANRLAHYLRTLGVGPEVLVGIYLERSPDLIIALLGILKAGGAYIPLDPAYPKERLAFMVQDAQPAVIVTESRLLETLPAHPARVVCLEAERSLIAAQDPTHPTSAVAATNLAYVMYTSGSTGQPKGVLIAHQGLCNVAASQQATFGITPLDRVLQFASLNFDASIFEIMMAFCSGAALYLFPREALIPGQEFLALLQEHAITTITLPPSILGLLPSAELPALRTLIVAGEDCPADLMGRWARSGRRIFNAYGPTEITIWATVALCGGDGGHPPIGRPIANTRAYLLDQRLQPVPVGIAGELYLGGVGVARGYLNRPDLSFKRFTADPFREAPGEYLYRTGDLARYRPDGQLEFLGRIDRQVKLHGVRIEPGEIEAALCQHPTVLKALVGLVECGPEDRRLVAYLLLRRDAPAPGALREFLQQRLPASLVPSAFLYLDDFPLLPSGKLDLARFPGPEQILSGAGEVAAPRTPLESQLVAMWQDVLHTSQISIHDNFFDLGGHSLHASQLVARLARNLGMEVPIKLLFQHPTIAGLAVALTDWHHPTGPTPAGLAGGGTPPPGSPVREPSSFTRLEARSLLALIATGELERVDAAALAYLTEDDFPGVERRALQHTLYEGHPVLSHYLATPWGRIAIITLPLYAHELYEGGERLAQVCLQARAMAASIGARVLTLTGLLPSATRYGLALLEASGENTPELSTGHATTTAAVACAIERILLESRRDLSRERVVFLGLGSIGLATLRLALTCLPHPQEVLLCDLYHKRAFLEEIGREIVSTLGYQGRVRLLTCRGRALPDEVYAASLIVGATNVPGVLDVMRVPPGTLIVDDSGPHCFDPAQAIERFEGEGDLLFTEGGVLQTPLPVQETIYFPAAWASRLGEALKPQPGHPFHITGCVLSGLLSACFEELPPTTGLIEAEVSWRHLARLRALRLQAAAPHCDRYMLNERRVHAFATRFGLKNSSPTREESGGT